MLVLLIYSKISILIFLLFYCSFGLGLGLINGYEINIENNKIFDNMNIFNVMEIYI